MNNLAIKNGKKSFNQENDKTEKSKLENKMKKTAFKIFILIGALAFLTNPVFAQTKRTQFSGTQSSRTQTTTQRKTASSSQTQSTQSRSSKSQSAQSKTQSLKSQNSQSSQKSKSSQTQTSRTQAAQNQAQQKSQTQNQATKSQSQPQVSKTQNGTAIDSIYGFELKIDEKGMPNLTSTEKSKYKVESVVYEPEGPLAPNTFAAATATLKAANGNYFMPQTIAIRGNKTAPKIVKLSKTTAVVKYSAWVEAKNELSERELKEKNKELGKGEIPHPRVRVAKGKKYDPVASIFENAKTLQPSVIRNYPTTKSISSRPLPNTVEIYDLNAERDFPGAVGNWYLIQDGNKYGYVPSSCVKDVVKENFWEGAPAVLKETPFKFEGGNGTEENPFLIKTPEQLNSIRFGLSRHYKLISDIDLSKWGNWIPIGGTPAYGGSYGGQGEHEGDYDSGKFTGSLDGNGHVISGMTIIDHRDDIFMGKNEASRSYALFAQTNIQIVNKEEKDAVIKNLGIVNYTIDLSYTKMKYNCYLNVAALSSYPTRLIVENCYTSGGKIKIHTGRAGSQSNRVFILAGGMFAEVSYAKITNCYNTSPLIITTSDTDYMNYNYLSNFTGNRSAVAGGIAGRMEYSHITSCMNSGEVKVPYSNFGAGNALVGGIVAKVTIGDGSHAIYDLPPEAASTITSCYNIGKLTGTIVGGIMGNTGTDCYVSDCYNAGELVVDEDNPQKDHLAIFKDDIVGRGSAILDYGKKYVHDNGINVVHGDRWIDSPKLGRKILKAIPEDKLGIKPSESEKDTQVAGFSDVKSSDVFALSVPWAVEKGIAKPSSKTTFSPNEPCTRGQVVTYIYRWQGSPKVSGKNPFKDVKPSDSFYNAALWAYKQGFLEGKTFNGNDPCTRGDALEILWKCSGSMSMIAIDNFTDVPRSSKYQQPVSWAYYGAIAKPTTKTTFEPESVCTKGQIVTFIYQVEHTGLKDWMDTTQKNANSNSSQIDAIYESTLKEMGLEDFLNGNQF